MKTTEEVLLSQHGPLMSIKDISQLLGKTISGVRTGLIRELPWTQGLLQARKRIGRRVYFKTQEVGRWLDENN
ncbi:MAG: helix-turn-helix domain-containing protein [Gallionella sp.]|nr:helix-turn-helix domain-containing protein [Gallionella sp.]